MHEEVHVNPACRAGFTIFDKVVICAKFSVGEFLLFRPFRVF